MRPTLFPLFLLLSACASAPKATAPTTPDRSPGVTASATESRVLEQFKRDLPQPTLVVRDVTDLFDMEADDDPMSVKLTSGPMLAVMYPQGGGKSTACDGDACQATVDITARPSPVVSPKVSAGTLRMAYANPGWTVSALQYDQNGTFGRFIYQGRRTNCADGEERCTKTRPVIGTVLVTRLAAQPEYTVVIRAEWHPALNPVIVSRLEAVIASTRIVHD